MGADPGGQDEVTAFLGDRRTHPGGGEVVHVQTHISHVFLAGSFVYKLKKAVRFPFLDFGTIAARERFCREEVALNRRLSPSVYLGVLPITRAGGSLRLGGDGEPVDWVVKMRRLPSDRRLGAMVEADAVPEEVVERVAGVIARFHAAAPVVEGGAPEALERAWTENLEGVRPLAGRALGGEDVDVLDDFGRTFVVRHDSVLRARPSLGHVRDGHGDLRADHVYVLDDPLPALDGAPPVRAGLHIVDCIEFSSEFRAIDVAADVAFLAMDLRALGRGDLSERFVRAYADATGDRLVEALVPYYACHRATVRGKVEALAADEPEVAPDERRRASGRAVAALALACRYAWSSGDPVVVACTGLSGTGKSAVASLVGEVTGWRVASSDVVRKTMGMPPERRYEPAAVAAVYGMLRGAVEEALGARASLVVDATFLARHERDALARTAHGLGARHVFVECVTDEALVRRRLDARPADAVSDARFDVYLRQKRTRDPLGEDEPVLRVDTSGPLATLRPTLVPRLWAWRQGRVVA